MHSAFSPDQSVLNLCSTATRFQRRRPKSRLRRSTLPRPVYESSFWTSKEVYQTSLNRVCTSNTRDIQRYSWRWPLFLYSSVAASSCQVLERHTYVVCINRNIYNAHRVEQRPESEARAIAGWQKLMIERVLVLTTALCEVPLLW